MKENQINGKHYMFNLRIHKNVTQTPLKPNQAISTLTQTQRGYSTTASKKNIH